MDSNLHDNDLLRSYLLGELSEPDVDRLELRLLEDDELFELSEAVEADLLAAYARGELTVAEGERVLHRLASSAGGQRRLALARSLNTIASESQPAPAPVVPLRRRAAPAPRPWTRWAALAATLVIAVAGALWLHPQRLQTTVTPVPPQPAKTSPGPEPTSPVPPNPPIPSPPPPPPRPIPVKPFVITLLFINPRGAEESGEEVKEFTVPAGTRTVEIQIDPEELGERKSFHVAVRNEGHKLVWEKNHLAPRLDGVMALDVPAEDLPSGSYEVAVTTEFGDITRPFKVVRKTR